MPGADEWFGESDDPIFGESAASSRPAPIQKVGEHRLVQPDLRVPTAIELRGPEDKVPTAPMSVRMIVCTVPRDVEHDVPEEDVPTEPVPVPLPVMSDKQSSVGREAGDERDVTVAMGAYRERRRVWMLGGLALAVVIGASLGGLALTRSSGSRPAVGTGVESTTTTTSTITSTMTIATTTPPPAASPPTAPPSPLRVPPPIQAISLPPDSAPPNPTTPDVAPPSPPPSAPAPEPPPSTSPPTTSTPPLVTTPP